MSQLQLIAVEKTYSQQVEALCGVNFEVPAGQLAVLVGPSGCGKTTTLRLIAGLDRPNRGEIRLDGQDLTRLPPRERGVAMVFQSPALYPHLTVGRNLAFPLRMRHVDSREIEERVLRAAGLLGIEDLLQRRPGELSGGEQQRVALGKALVQEPRLWLLDEPLASLDAPLRRQLGREIADLQKQTGTTTLFVTHDQSEALAYGDWLIVMRDGRVHQTGTPTDVYTHPTSRFVASFLGDPPMNLLRGQVMQGVFRAADISLRLRGNVPDGAVELGIRPEDLAVANESEPMAVHGIVRRVEFRGHAVVAEVGVGKQMLLVRMGPVERVAAGDGVRLRLPTENCHLFDAASGERLQYTGFQPL